MSRAKQSQLKPATVRAQLEAQGIEIEWNTAEVAAYLAFSPDLILQLCHRRQIPHRRIALEGRERMVFRFRKEDIDAWRDKNSEVITA